MSINLWEAGGKPTSYNSLPSTWTEKITIDIRDYEVSFQAKSASSAKLGVKQDTQNIYPFNQNLTTDFVEYKFSFTNNMQQPLYIKASDTVGDIVIKNIKVTEKSMGKATINGADGFLSGKWALPYNVTVIDDETIELDAVALNQGGNLEIPVLPNTDYIASFEIGKWAIANMSGVTNGLLSYGEGIRKFNSGANTRIKFFFSNTTTGTGKFTFKRPMINLGAVPAPYEKKRGERMVMPISKKNMLPSFDGLSRGSLTRVSDYKATLVASGNYGSGNYTMSVEPYTNYYFQCTHNGMIGIYDTDANTAIQAYTTSQSFTFNSGNRTMLRAYMGNGSLGAGTYTFENWQIEQGSVGTDFAPYEAQKVNRVNNANFDVPATGTGNPFNWGHLIKFNEERIFKSAEIKSYGTGSIIFTLRTLSSTTPIYQKSFDVVDGINKLDFDWKIPKGLYALGTMQTDHVSMSRNDALTAQFFPRPNNDGSVEVLGGVSTTPTTIDPASRVYNWYFLFNMKFDGVNKDGITTPKKNLYKGFISAPFGFTSAIMDRISEREMLYTPEMLNRNSYVMMDVEPNTTYSVSFTAISTTPLNGKMAVYNDDASSNLSGAYIATPFTFFSGNRTKVRLYLKNELAIEPITFKDIQFEKGSVTPYETYELTNKPSRKGLSLDGKSDYVRYQGFADFANRNFTIESSFTWNGTNAVDNAQQTIFSCGDIRFGINNQATGFVGVYTPASNWITTQIDLRKGGRYKMKAIYTPDYFSLYIDDVFMTGKAYTGTIAPYSQSFVGNLGGGSYFFNGIIHTMNVVIDDKTVIDLNFDKSPANTFGNTIVDKNGAIGTLMGNPTPLNKLAKR